MAEREQHTILGIDIGGSGIKGAPVNVKAGELVENRRRIRTPQPSKPEAVAGVVAEIARHFDWTGPIGVTFPAIIRKGVIHTAANVDQDWIGTDGRLLFEQATGCPVTLLNDADAAGIAEMTFGAGRDCEGTVLVLTLGTGIGSALYRGGLLVPNTEFGHLIYQGSDAEHYAAESVREREHLSWREWGRRVDGYLRHLDMLLSPDLIIIGGGGSKMHERYFPYFTLDTPVVPARMLNQAGIIGAALAASNR